MKDHEAGKIPTYKDIKNIIDSAITKYESTGQITDLRFFSSRTASQSENKTRHDVLIPTIRFRKNPIEASNNIAIIVAGIHGDEFYGTTTLFEVIKTLIKSYDSTSQEHVYQTSILDKMEIWIVAVANPDRHIVIEELSKHIQGKSPSYSNAQRTTMAQQICNTSDLIFCRKNVSKLAEEFGASKVYLFGSDTVNLNSFLDRAYSDFQDPSGKRLFYGATNSHYLNGVDLNRNFSTAGFGLAAETKSETSDQYCGETKASELETQVIQEIILSAVAKATSQKKEVRLLIDVHTKKLGIYRSLDMSATPLGASILKALKGKTDSAGNFIDSMPEGPLTEYDSPTSGDGSCEDYATSNGVKNALTFEISNAGAGLYPVKDSSGVEVSVDIVTTSAKDAILRALEVAANGS